MRNKGEISPDHKNAYLSCDAGNRTGRDLGGA